MPEKTGHKGKVSFKNVIKSLTLAHRQRWTTFPKILLIKSSQNVIAKPWDLSHISRPFCFLTQSLCLHVLDMWGKKGRSYGGRQSWEQRQGYNFRLYLGRSQIQRAPSAAVLAEFWVSDATSWWAHQLCLALGHGNVSVVRCLQHEIWQIFSSCEMMLFHA